MSEQPTTEGSAADIVNARVADELPSLEGAFKVRDRMKTEAVAATEQRSRPEKRYTTRVDSRGDPYPRCCVGDCDKPVYSESDWKCWTHYSSKP